MLKFVLSCPVSRGSTGLIYTWQFITVSLNWQIHAMQRAGITKQYMKRSFYLNNSWLGSNILCRWHKTKNIRVGDQHGLTRTWFDTFFQHLSHYAWNIMPEILALLVSAYMVSDKISENSPAGKLFVWRNTWGSHSAVADDSSVRICYKRCYSVSLSSCSQCFWEPYCLQNVRKYLLDCTASCTRQHWS